MAGPKEFGAISVIFPPRLASKQSLGCLLVFRIGSLFSNFSDSRECQSEEPGDTDTGGWLSRAGAERVPTTSSQLKSLIN